VIISTPKRTDNNNDDSKLCGSPSPTQSLAAAIKNTSNELTNNLLNQTTSASTSWRKRAEQDTNEENLIQKHTNYYDAQHCYGSEHPQTLAAAKYLARELHHQHQSNRAMDDAEKLFRDTLAIQRRTIGLTHSNTLETANMLVNTLRSKGNYAEAIQFFSETLAAEK